jgi:choline/ethanolamine kinase
MDGTSFESDIAIIKTFIKSWDIACADEIQFERLPGLTNVIYKVKTTNPNATPSSIIYRKFGKSGDIIDREKEDYIFTELSKRAIGPTYYGINHDMRLEGFYESRSVKPEEASHKVIRRNIAKGLANLNQARLEGLDETPMFLKMLEKGSYAKLAKEKARKDIYTEEEQGWLRDILSLVSEEEINFLKALLRKNKNEVVFSHNDLHLLNILLLDGTQQVKLIDYEYSAYNYRGYDIANFFNELTFDYTNPDYPYYTMDWNKYSSKEDLLEFIRYYLFFSKYSDTVFDEDLLVKDEGYFQHILSQTVNLDDFTAEVEEILVEVKTCAMLSHYYWVLWSIIMSKNSEIEFDYLNYAHARYGVYQKLKKELLASQSANQESA